MAMRYGLTRADYEQLFGVAASERQFLTPAGLEVLDKPCETSAAVTELRARGYAVTHDMLVYLVRKAVANPTKKVRGLFWSKSDIDAVADHCESEQIYTPGTVARMVYNISPLQDALALREAQRRWPEVFPGAFVVTIWPGRPGANEYGKIQYSKA
jgi:hypothetical protein